ncbi:Chaperone protein DnaJ, partial [Stegodyphus mimosarum]
MLSFVKFRSFVCSCTSFVNPFYNSFKYFSDCFVNYYSILGLQPKASDEEIKEAYYSLSKKYHPDMNIGNEAASAKILEINEAFEILGNKVEKEKYDEKMFPKVAEKRSHHFIYNHDVYSEAPNYTYVKPQSFIKKTYTPEQYSKRAKGILKRKNQHLSQKCRFFKYTATQKLPQVMRRK